MAFSSYRTIIDISLPIKKGMITYPGNPEVRFEERRGTTSVHSEITMGSHTGTHVDALKHVVSDWGGTELLPLNAFIGPCRVLECTGVTDALRIRDLEGAALQAGERILIKTRNSQRGFDRFFDDYVYLDGDAADYVAQRRLALFGVDALSVKQRGGIDNRSHTALLQNNVVILEGLDLSRVIPGVYTLVCLPLSFVGLDGAPARALLLAP